MRAAFDYLVSHIRETAKDATELVVPVSGGTDGALTFLACARALPEKTRAVYFGRNLRCHDWFQSVGPVDLLESPPPDVDKEAVRWSTIMSIYGPAWTVGSRNRTEDILGTYSRASRVATFLPIVGVWKSDVMKLCDFLDVPEPVCASSRQPDPECGRPQEFVDVGIERIDAFLKSHLGLDGQDLSTSLSADHQRYLVNLLEANMWKRSLPTRGPELEISVQAAL